MTDLAVPCVREDALHALHVMLWIFLVLDVMRLMCVCCGMAKYAAPPALNRCNTLWCAGQLLLNKVGHAVAEGMLIVIVEQCPGGTITFGVQCTGWVVVSLSCMSWVGMTTRTQSSQSADQALWVSDMASTTVEVGL